MTIGLGLCIYVWLYDVNVMSILNPLDFSKLGVFTILFM